MKLNEQLRIERKNNRYSITNLAEKIAKNTGLFFSESAIRNWENGQHDIDIRALAYLSDLYGVSIEDLVSEEIEPKLNYEDIYYQFGKEISEYCSVEDSTEFMIRYEIVDKSQWITAPKYDLIMRCYEDYLRENQPSYYACLGAYRYCEYWLQRDDRSKYNKTNLELFELIYDDRAGKVGVNEKRDPINHIKLISELEMMLGDIRFDLECASEGDGTVWECS